MRKRRRARARSEAFEAINITPFTDVLLVLLIIFMIAGSSLAPTGLGLSAVASVDAEGMLPDKPALLVEIDRDGTTRLSFAEESLLWSEAAKLPQGTQVTLSIDPATPAEQVVRQYDRLLDAGLRDIEWAPPRRSGI